MPSFQDSALIFVIALLLFGPKKLPELARQLGKLMGEFRRASNDFRMQMEDELRMAEQADRQKKIAEIEAAAPVTPALEASSSEASTHEASPYETVDYVQTETQGAAEYAVEEKVSEVVPIASEGDLRMMPPDTGLPVGRGGGSESALTPLLDAIPEAPTAEIESHTHGAENARVDQHG